MSSPFEKKPFGGGAGAGPGGRGDFRSKGKDKDGLRVNREIRAPSIRVIDEAGTMLGVMTVLDGVKLAEERGLDLIEIAPTASPPTCKIMDYGKWKYENKKKTVAARKKQVIIQIKEIQLRPRTDVHDFETKMKHARRFLLDGDKVKVSMRFMGREMAHQELGMSLMRKVIQVLGDVGINEAPPKMEGKQAFLIIQPDAVKVKEYMKLHPKATAEKAPDADAGHDKDADDEE